jgi:hypothetical protein
MNALFFALFTGHLVADFWLQPTSWVNCKRTNGLKSKRLLLHAALASVLPVVFTLQIALWWFIPIIFISHYLIDFAKTKTSNNLLAFAADQVLHIAVLMALARYASPESPLMQNPLFWKFAAGFVLVTTPSGIMIGKFLQTITNTESTPLKTNASAWIGIVERILILIFILIEQYQAIGFLVAAKSIFRFSEIQKEGNPKAEYFLLGTLVSFLAAVIVGMGIKAAIN